MARMRKIPVRHHHGVRDPLKQKEEKEQKLKNVTNNPPEENSQKLSRKFLQFKKLVDAAKVGRKIPKRLSAGKEDLPKPIKSLKGNKKETETTNTKKIKFVNQFPGEEDVDYLKRVNRITSQSLREAQYEAKYGVRVVRNEKTGEIKIEKKPKNEIDELLKQKEKDRLLAKRGKHLKTQKQNEKEKMDPKMAKELIKQVLREEKEEKRKERVEEYKQDHVKFGEVVHAPPTLKTLPRKATKADTVPRPGKKNNLLLKTMLDGDTSKKPIVTPQRSVTKAQLKGKRKDLPAATRNMLEKERNKFVELYRNLKKAKETQNNGSL